MQGEIGAQVREGQDAAGGPAFGDLRDIRAAVELAPAGAVLEQGIDHLRLEAVAIEPGLDLAIPRRRHEPLEEGLGDVAQQLLASRAPCIGCGGRSAVGGGDRAGVDRGAGPIDLGDLGFLHVDDLEPAFLDLDETRGGKLRGSATNGIRVHAEPACDLRFGKRSPVACGEEGIEVELDGEAVQRGEIFGDEDVRHQGVGEQELAAFIDLHLSAKPSGVHPLIFENLGKFLDYPPVPHLWQSRNGRIPSVRGVEGARPPEGTGALHAGGADVRRRG